MVPTYFRRELRDRVLQRRSRPSTFVLSVSLLQKSFGALAVILRACGVSSTPRLLVLITNGSAILDHSLSRVTTARTRPSHDDQPFRKPICAQSALAKRDALSDEQRAVAALRPWPSVLCRLRSRRGAIVSGYSPIRNEIDPALLMQHLAGLGARLALPVVPARGKSLIFRAWSPDDRLMLGPLGIP